jgi:hypothetical protein
LHNERNSSKQKFWRFKYWSNCCATNPKRRRERGMSASVDRKRVVKLYDPVA